MIEQTRSASSRRGRSNRPAPASSPAICATSGGSPIPATTRRRCSTRRPASVVTYLSTQGVDLSGAIAHARTVGQASLGALTFHQRALLLKEFGKALTDAQGGAVRALEARRRHGARLARSTSTAASACSSRTRRRGAASCRTRRCTSTGPSSRCRRTARSSAVTCTRGCPASPCRSTPSTSRCGARSRSSRPRSSPACRRSSSPRPRPRTSPRRGCASSSRPGCFPPARCSW